MEIVEWCIRVSWVRLRFAADVDR